MNESILQNCEPLIEFSSFYFVLIFFRSIHSFINNGNSKNNNNNSTKVFFWFIKSRLEIKILNEWIEKEEREKVEKKMKKEWKKLIEWKALDKIWTHLQIFSRIYVCYPIIIIIIGYSTLMIIMLMMMVCHYSSNQVILFKKKNSLCYMFRRWILFSIIEFIIQNEKTRRKNNGFREWMK